MLFKASIEKLMIQQDLDSFACQNALDQILSGHINPVQASAFLVLLRAKSETSEELSALASALRQKMQPIFNPHPVLDIVGTGGDGANTVNISTGSAILAASCGVKVAKHGNRAVSSRSGSADVLEALGIRIELTADQINSCIDQVGIGFCYAPTFNPALDELRALRKELKIPTSLNIIAPLLNPLNPQCLLLGLYDESMLSTMATTLQTLGTDKSIMMHGSGLDEISCLGPAKLIEVTKTEIKEFYLDPECFGMSRCQLTDLQGGDADRNAQLLLQAFSSGYSKKHRAIADTLILNAGVALYLYGLYANIQEGVSHAREFLYGGYALTLLNNWIEFSHD